MADYWKSQPRKFCQYCKCWIADNKPSIEFHERGKNHKENVAAKISEIKKKSVEKAKQEKKMCKQFAAMEEAAVKAYEEDLKRMEMEARGLSVPAPAVPQPPENQQAKKEKKKKEEKVKPRRQEEVWVEGRTDEGHLYYYSTLTGESRWEKPEHSGGSAPVMAAVAAGSSSSAWMEAVSPNGYTYYYNTETGESSWEKPSDFSSSEELLPPGTLPEAGGSSEPTVESREAPDQPEQQTNAPKINFRVRKKPKPSSCGDQEVQRLQLNDPVCSQKRKSEDPGKEEGEEEKRIRTEEEETRGETKTDGEQEVQRTAVEPEPGLEPGPGPGPEPAPNVKIQVKRARTSSPYGTWEKIKEEKDPYANVNLQLPQVEESFSSGAADLPPEAKPKFKERVITSLGDDGEGGEPATFRRNHGHNGKSRRLRQRDDKD